MTIRSISAVLTDLGASLTGERISVAQIIEGLHERGLGFLLFIFSVPMALPLPDPPGVSIIFATPMIILSVQQIMGVHNVWMPERITRISFTRERYDSVMEMLKPYLEWIEKVFRPRFGFMTQGVFSRLIGVAGLIMSLTACLPVPLTHTIPSCGVVLMAVGVIMRDGLAVIAGVLVGLGWITALALAVILLGAEGLEVIRHTIHSLLS